MKLLFPKIYAAPARWLRVRLFRALLVAVLLMMMMGGAGTAGAEDALESYRAVREAFVANFRTSGARDRSRLDAITQGLHSLAEGSEGELQARAMLELGTVLRLQNDFTAASETLTRAAEHAEALSLPDVTFDAWTGVARVRMYMREHGAAEIAFERAVDAAGKNPTSKQSFDVADIGSQLLEKRGEIEAALVEAMSAAYFAPDPDERFYADYGISEILYKFVTRCHHFPMRDARSTDDASIRWDACRRAGAAAEAASRQAERRAENLGWSGMVRLVREQRNSLEVQRRLLEEKASFFQKPEIKDIARRLSEPRDRSSLSGIISRNFEAGPTVLPGPMPLADLLKQSVPDADPWAGLAEMMEQSVAEGDLWRGKPDARSFFLSAMAAGIRNGSGKPDVNLLVQAAAELSTERAGFFDPRRRGTTLEDNSEIIRESMSSN
jgi:hypothetical protein